MSSPLPSAPSATNPLDHIGILKHILSFIGPNQYRFVAGTSRRFREAYLDVIPSGADEPVHYDNDSKEPYPFFPKNMKTYVNASTVGYAEICWNEIKDKNFIRFFGLRKEIGQEALSRSAAAHGNLPALQFLRSVNCPWHVHFCATAARNNHWHVLK